MSAPGPPARLPTGGLGAGGPRGVQGRRPQRAADVDVGRHPRCQRNPGPPWRLAHRLLRTSRRRHPGTLLEDRGGPAFPAPWGGRRATGTDRARVQPGSPKLGNPVRTRAHRHVPSPGWRPSRHGLRPQVLPARDPLIRARSSPGPADGSAAGDRSRREPRLGFQGRDPRDRLPPAQTAGFAPAGAGSPLQG